MFNYGNLSDVEFEHLCRDVMSRMLGLSLRRFTPGKDGGVDLFSDARTAVVVQVKHYRNASSLVAALRDEVPKVNKLSPRQYYVCCSLALTPKRVRDIYGMFSGYMESDRNIVTLIEIDDFLCRPENGDILEKHYKLWLESTGVLEKLLDGQLFVDCETLMADIERDRKLFVRTGIFDKAVKYLRESKALLLVGDPGIGKTMTSEMLAFHFAAEGYQIRYSASYSDLSALKRALSADRDGKVLALIDDCFGQAYMDLHTGQGKELLSLIKYIRVAKNKLLIMNSRITIFHEVKARLPDYERAFADNHYGVYTLDMSDMDMLDRAKIFYNHLYANGVGRAYFEDIRRERRYRWILAHENFNPRIVEFVSTPARLRDVKPDEYFAFIMKNLDDPKEVWRDEYENRLGLPDRMLLLTVYSLSDYASEVPFVRQCFDDWAKNTPSLDPTVNQFDASLQRLTGGFLRLSVGGAEQSVEVINPSVNDFLRRHIADTPAEREAILKNAATIRQFARLMSSDEFLAFAHDAFASGSLGRLIFNSETEKNTFIAYHVVTYKTTDPRYAAALRAFLRHPSSSLYICGTIFRGPEILKELTCEPFISFYDLGSVLDEDDLPAILADMGPNRTAVLINALSPLFTGEKREPFVQISADAMADEIAAYCDEVDAADYDPDVDSSIHMAQWGGEVDKDDAAFTIEDEVCEKVLDDLRDIIRSLPPDIACARNYLTGVYIDVCGADDLVEEYLADSFDEDQDPDDDDDNDGTDEIDRMFDRDPT